mmetsp:Transcript_60455/g.155831  ORF Transcript_60455/g.155831 Transcript_60455/m.155831 type:complete len:295 (-) Transcript_60455:125-1009(-)|eukprot:CAMPEP_0195072118 /NCGR_PEP_ID=MMETSP0448-20130528/15777_1 /TAXON_ID=66468 /ORGANISM="Heterocapsa triquestra, Strain CCMP 448" /LENGTH=294 /DNA_ID=CAMNT_0040104063 /DNA_START=45 /DNA_END=929 /DNA_ORIENTATION=-
MHNPEPDLQPGESSIGAQRQSVRPSSARYSFPRRPREGQHKAEGPGPTEYEVRSFSHQSACRAAVFGTSPQIEGTKQYQYPDLEADYVYDDSAAYPSARAAVFGTLPRDVEVIDTEFIRQCPESRFGRASPGLVYEPNDKCVGGKTRPRSAPSYSMRARTSPSVDSLSRRSRGSAPPHAYGCEGAMGNQLNSKRRTSRSSSFSHASRFGADKEAAGQQTEQWKRISDITGSAKQKRVPCATFGSATRVSSARVAVCRLAADQHPAQRMLPPRMPHPRVAPVPERIRLNGPTMVR